MNIDKARFLLLTTSIAAMAIAGCSDDHPANEHADAGGHSSPYPSCDAIIKECHAKDIGEGPVSECHSLAHDATGDDVCAPRKDECVTICREAVVDLDAG